MEKGTKRRGRAATYLPRAISIVVAGGLVQVALANLMLAPLAGDDSAWSRTRRWPFDETALVYTPGEGIAAR
jgi:hypothetical protein